MNSGEYTAALLRLGYFNSKKYKTIMNRIRDSYLFFTGSSKKYLGDINYLVSKTNIPLEKVFFVYLKGTIDSLLEKEHNYSFLEIKSLSDILTLDESNFIIGYGRGFGGYPFDQLGYFLSKFPKKMRVQDGVLINKNSFNFSINDTESSLIKMLITYLRFYGFFNVLKIISYKITKISIDSYIVINYYGVLEFNKIIENETI